MKVAIVTGSAGLIGSAAVRRFAAEGYHVVGIDNDMRSYFFGEQASTDWQRRQLEEQIPNYKHLAADIRDWRTIERLFKEYGSDIKVVIHAAAQPSHDWAAKEPVTDFTINANGTLNILEASRLNSPEAVFIFTSTNKVYGDSPNLLPLVEYDERWELDPQNRFAEHGIDESMSVDQSKHSIFGASKVAADIMVQEYGRYFGLKTGVFRGGCLTGPGHSGAELHGFLAYLMKCAIGGAPYKIFGYKGKQVRDNIHSDDLVSCFLHFANNPRPGEVYNIGGSRKSNCSLLEAIRYCEEITGRKLECNYISENRQGDHIWWISDTRKFEAHYPEWRLNYTLKQTLIEIYDELLRREVRRAKDAVSRLGEIEW